VATSIERVDDKTRSIYFTAAGREKGEDPYYTHHENNIYNNTWSEKHHGIREVEKDGKVTFEYDIEKNSELAKNLKGHLMLVHGEMDNNVHPANTYRRASCVWRRVSLRELAER
jgi:hypothetical protein